MPAPQPHSLIDRVDVADRVVGTVRRDEVFATEAGFRVVHIFVFDASERLLVQQLGRLRDRNPLHWGSSVAGYLHAGESYADGAKRRLLEELRLESKLVKHGSTHMSDRGCMKFIGVFTTRVESDMPSIGESHHIERLAWMELRELDRELTSKPERFTATFRHVYRFFRSTRGL